MVVHRRYVKTSRSQFCDDGIQLALEQDQIAHDHRTVVGSEKRRPRAKRKAWLNRKAVHGNVQIASRKTNLIYVACLLPRAPHDFIDRPRGNSLRADERW